MGIYDKRDNLIERKVKIKISYIRIFCFDQFSRINTIKDLQITLSSVSNWNFLNIFSERPPGLYNNPGQVKGGLSLQLVK